MADMFSRAKRSWIMARIRSRDTKPELHVRSALHRHGYRFRLQATDLPGKPDIVLRRHRTAIFVHGCFWHGHAHCKDGRRPKSNTKYWNGKIGRNIERDSRRSTEYRRLGWKRIVVWECEISQPDAAARRLTKLLKQLAS